MIQKVAFTATGELYVQNQHFESTICEQAERKNGEDFSSPF